MIKCYLLISVFLISFAACQSNINQPADQLENWTILQSDSTPILQTIESNFHENASERTGASTNQSGRKTYRKSFINLKNGHLIKRKEIPEGESNRGSLKPKNEFRCFSLRLNDGRQIAINGPNLSIYSDSQTSLQKLSLADQTYFISNAKQNSIQAEGKTPLSPPDQSLILILSTNREKNPIIYGLNTRTLKIVWSKAFLKLRQSTLSPNSPLVDAQLVGTQLILVFPLNIYCLNVQSGREEWVYDL